MSRCKKCSSCGEDIEIGEKLYIIDDEFYCDMCVTADTLDESYFEEDDSHTVLEERILREYE